MQNIVTSSNSSFLNESNIENKLFNITDILPNNNEMRNLLDDEYQDQQASSIDLLEVHSAPNSPCKDGIDHVYGEENYNNGKSIKSGMNLPNIGYATGKYEPFFEEIHNAEISHMFDNHNYFTLNSNVDREPLVSSASHIYSASDAFHEVKQRSENIWFPKISSHLRKHRSHRRYSSQSSQISRSSSYMSYFKDKLSHQNNTQRISRRSGRRRVYKKYSSARKCPPLSISSRNNRRTSSNSRVSTYRSQQSLDRQISCEDIYDIYADVFDVASPISRIEAIIENNSRSCSNINDEKYKSWSPLKLLSPTYHSSNDTNQYGSSRKSIRKKIHEKVSEFWKPKTISLNIQNSPNTGSDSIKSENNYKSKNSKIESMKKWLSINSGYDQFENQKNSLTSNLTIENQFEEAHEITDDYENSIMSNDLQNRISTGILKQRKQYV